MCIDPNCPSKAEWKKKAAKAAATTEGEQVTAEVVRFRAKLPKPRDGDHEEDRRLRCPQERRSLVRVDLNSPVENGKITGSARINAHAKTIKTLSDRGAARDRAFPPGKGRP